MPITDVPTGSEEQPPPPPPPPPSEGAAAAPPPPPAPASDAKAASSAAAPPLSEDVGAAPSESTAARRTAYLEYLRSCLRQQRPPAPEVVEVARTGLQADGSLIALQIRSTEEQLSMLGMLHLPRAAPIAVG